MSDPRWRDLGVRAASGLVLAAVGVWSMVEGGTIWTLCIFILATGMVTEWVILCGRRRLLWLAGLPYIVPAVAALIWLRGLPLGLRWVAFLAAVIWAGDVGAYMAGRLLGGRRLAPRISPGKTWSGAAGGLISSVAAGAAIWSAETSDHVAGAGSTADLSTVVLMAAALGIVAQAGDLLESALKRYFGVKDSSNLIPGHGGLLDRLDGVLTAAPLAAVFALVSSG